MPSKPVRAIGLYQGSCPIIDTLSKTTEDFMLKPLQLHTRDGKVVLWAKVKGSKRRVKTLMRGLSRIKGSTYTIVNGSNNSSLISISLPKSACKATTCPLSNPPEGILVLSSLITPKGILVLIVSPSLRNLSKAEESGLTILDLIDAGEPAMLTSDQEKVLVYAYERGYYEYPRKATLKDLSESLGLSISTLAESLRRAERKTMNSIVLDDLILHKYKDEIGEKEEK